MKTRITELLGVRHPIVQGRGHAYLDGVDPRVMQQGDLDAGAWSCGMGAGLIHDLPTVRERIDRVVAEAESIASRRFRSFGLVA